MRRCFGLMALVLSWTAFVGNLALTASIAATDSWKSLQTFFFISLTFTAISFFCNHVVPHLFQPATTEEQRPLNRPPVQSVIV